MKIPESVTSTNRIIVGCAAIVVVIAGMRTASGILAPLLMAAFISHHLLGAAVLAQAPRPSPIPWRSS